MTPNPTVAGLEDVQKRQEYLFELRCELSRTKVSLDWTEKDIDKVLKNLKNNKARDAHGHTYELFKYAGIDLKLSLLKLCNAVKFRKLYPKIFQPSNITSLYKKRVKRLI